MNECDLDTAVPDWVIEHPETLAVFQELGIDYGCGGKSLAYACRNRGLDAATVLSRLQRCLETSPMTNGLTQHSCTAPQPRID